jgi:hypothetical protein
MRLRNEAGALLSGVLIASAGLFHSHTKDAIVLAIIGVVASWFVAYDIGRTHSERHSAPSVRLVGMEGAVFTQQAGNYMVMWLQLRARNNREATVLTDWGATLTLAGEDYTATHVPNEPFVADMRNQVRLDQETAATRLHGEITGWVAFGFPFARNVVASHVEQQLPVTVKVSVLDSRGTPSDTEIDLTRLWRDQHREVR